MCRARSAETGAPPGEDAGAMPKGPPRAEAARASGRLPPPRATGGASRRGRLHRCGRRPATATRPSATAAPPGRRHVADTEADPPPAKRRRRARDSEDGWRFLPIRCFFIKVQTVFVRTQRTPNGPRCSVNATSPRGGKPKHACASRGRGGPCAAASGTRQLAEAHPPPVLPLCVVSVSVTPFSVRGERTPKAAKQRKRSDGPGSAARGHTAALGRRAAGVWLGFCWT